MKYQSFEKVADIQDPILLLSPKKLHSFPLENWALVSHYDEMSDIGIYILTKTKEIADVEATSVRGVSYEDFKKAITQIRPSVSLASLEGYRTWNKQYGCVSS